MRETEDLFTTHEGRKQIPMQDAEMYFWRHFLPADMADTVLHHLIADVPWRAEHIVMWGKTFPLPRLTAWYGDFGKHYTYFGLQLQAVPWTRTLLALKRRVEAVAKTAFNSVLLTYYRDHRDSVGFHSDDEWELGERPIIASVSVGEARTFILKHKTRPAVKPVRLNLVSGSLLLMQGETQRYWRHGINKEADPCGPCVNLTFRRIGA